MLIACTMDGENKIIPVAYAICKTECKESWTWFLKLLHESIGDLDDLTFISDRAASIATSIATVFPNAHHGICGHHLYSNIATHCGKSDIINILFWKACKAYTTEEFDEHIQSLHQYKPSAATYVLRVDRNKWARAHFPGKRYNMMTSNSAESLNSLSRYARRMPVVMLVDFFRATLQQWYFQHRNEAAELKTTLTTWAEDKVKKRKDRSMGWIVYPITNTRYRVDDTKRGGLVDFQQLTCTCRKWQLSGIPCGHVIRVLTSLNYQDCASYTINAYQTTTLRQTYEECVNPLPAPCDWEVPDGLMIVKPPVMEIRQPGRPRNRDRIPSQGEGQIIKECSRCGKNGHTRGECTGLQSGPGESSSQTPFVGGSQSVHLSDFRFDLNN